MRALPVAAALFATLAGAGARAEDELPDLAFLEYLGSWQESDEEWLLIAEWDAAAAPEVDEARDEAGKPEDDEGSKADVTAEAGDDADDGKKAADGRERQGSDDEEGV